MCAHLCVCVCVPVCVRVTPELSGNTFCPASSAITSVSIPSSLYLNYTSAKALCSRNNGTILSESSFQAGCSPRNVFAWRGLPNAENKALTTYGNSHVLAARLRVVCEIRESMFILF